MNPTEFINALNDEKVLFNRATHVHIHQVDDEVTMWTADVLFPGSIKVDAWCIAPSGMAVRLYYKGKAMMTIKPFGYEVIE